MQIFTLDLTGKITPLQVEPSDKIYDLQLKMNGLTGIPMGHKFIFAGQLLHNKKTLADYYIQEGATLHLIWP